MTLIMIAVVSSFSRSNLVQRARPGLTSMFTEKEALSIEKLICFDFEMMSAQTGGVMTRQRCLVTTPGADAVELTQHPGVR